MSIYVTKITKYKLGEFPSENPSEGTAGVYFYNLYYPRGKTGVLYVEQSDVGYQPYLDYVQDANPYDAFGYADATENAQNNGSINNYISYTSDIHNFLTGFYSNYNFTSNQSSIFYNGWAPYYVATTGFLNSIKPIGDVVRDQGGCHPVCNQVLFKNYEEMPEVLVLSDVTVYYKNFIADLNSSLINKWYLSFDDIERVVDSSFPGYNYKIKAYPNNVYKVKHPVTYIENDVSDYVEFALRDKILGGFKAIRLFNPVGYLDNKPRLFLSLSVEGTTNGKFLDKVVDGNGSRFDGGYLNSEIKYIIDSQGTNVLQYLHPTSMGHAPANYEVTDRMLTNTIAFTSLAHFVDAKTNTLYPLPSDYFFDSQSRYYMLPSRGNNNRLVAATFNKVYDYNFEHTFVIFGDDISDLSPGYSISQLKSGGSFSKIQLDVNYFSFDFRFDSYFEVEDFIVPESYIKVYSYQKRMDLTTYTSETQILLSKSSTFVLIFKPTDLNVSSYHQDTFLDLTINGITYRKYLSVFPNYGEKLALTQEEQDDGYYEYVVTSSNTLSIQTYDIFPDFPITSNPLTTIDGIVNQNSGVLSYVKLSVRAMANEGGLYIRLVFKSDDELLDISEIDIENFTVKTDVMGSYISPSLTGEFEDSYTYFISNETFMNISIKFWSATHYISRIVNNNITYNYSSFREVSTSLFTTTISNVSTDFDPYVEVYFKKPRFALSSDSSYQNILSKVKLDYAFSLKRYDGTTNLNNWLTVDSTVEFRSGVTLAVDIKSELLTNYTFNNAAETVNLLAGRRQMRMANFFNNILLSLNPTKFDLLLNSAFFGSANYKGNEINYVKDVIKLDILANGVVIGSTDSINIINIYDSFRIINMHNLLTADSKLAIGTSLSSISNLNDIDVFDFNRKTRITYTEQVDNLDDVFYSSQYYIDTFRHPAEVFLFGKSASRVADVFVNDTGEPHSTPESLIKFTLGYQYPIFNFYLSSFISSLQNNRTVVSHISVSYKLNFYPIYTETGSAHPAPVLKFSDSSGLVYPDVPLTQFLISGDNSVELYNNNTERQIALSPSPISIPVFFNSLFTCSLDSKNYTFPSTSIFKSILHDGELYWDFEKSVTFDFFCCRDDIGYQSVFVLFFKENEIELLYLDERSFNPSNPPEVIVNFNVGKINNTNKNLFIYKSAIIDQDIYIGFSTESVSSLLSYFTETVDSSTRKSSFSIDNTSFFGLKEKLIFSSIATNITNKSAEITVNNVDYSLYPSISFDFKVLGVQSLSATYNIRFVGQTNTTIYELNANVENLNNGIDNHVTVDLISAVSDLYDKLYEVKIYVSFLNPVGETEEIARTVGNIYIQSLKSYYYPYLPVYVTSNHELSSDAVVDIADLSSSMSLFLVVKRSVAPSGNVDFTAYPVNTDGVSIDYTTFVYSSINMSDSEYTVEIVNAGVTSSILRDVEYQLAATDLTDTGYLYYEIKIFVPRDNLTNEFQRLLTFTSSFFTDYNHSRILNVNVSDESATPTIGFSVQNSGACIDNVDVTLSLKNVQYDHYYITLNYEFLNGSVSNEHPTFNFYPSRYSDSNETVSYTAIDLDPDTQYYLDATLWYKILGDSFILHPKIDRIVLPMFYSSSRVTNIVDESLLLINDNPNNYNLWLFLENVKDFKGSSLPLASNILLSASSAAFVTINSLDVITKLEDVLLPETGRIYRYIKKYRFNINLSIIESLPLIYNPFNIHFKYTDNKFETSDNNLLKFRDNRKLVLASINNGEYKQQSANITIVNTDSNILSIQHHLYDKDEYVDGIVNCRLTFINGDNVNFVGNDELIQTSLIVDDSRLYYFATTFNLDFEYDMLDEEVYQKNLEIKYYNNDTTEIVANRVSIPFTIKTYWSELTIQASIWGLTGLVNFKDYTLNLTQNNTENVIAVILSKTGYDLLAKWTLTFKFIKADEICYEDFYEIRYYNNIDTQSFISILDVDFDRSDDLYNYKDIVIDNSLNVNNVTTFYFSVKALAKNITTDCLPDIFTSISREEYVDESRTAIVDEKKVVYNGISIHTENTSIGKEINIVNSDNVLINSLTLDITEHFPLILKVNFLNANESQFKIQLISSTAISVADIDYIGFFINDEIDIEFLVLDNIFNDLLVVTLPSSTDHVYLKIKLAEDFTSETAESFKIRVENIDRDYINFLSNDIVVIDDSVELTEINNLNIYNYYSQVIDSVNCHLTLPSINNKYYIKFIVSNFDNFFIDSEKYDLSLHITPNNHDDLFSYISVVKLDNTTVSFNSSGILESLNGIALLGHSGSDISYEIPFFINSPLGNQFSYPNASVINNFSINLKVKFNKKIYYDLYDVEAATTLKILSSYVYIYTSNTTTGAKNLYVDSDATLSSTSFSLPQQNNTISSNVSHNINISLNDTVYVIYATSIVKSGADYKYFYSKVGFKNYPYIFDTWNPLTQTITIYDVNASIAYSVFEISPKLLNRKAYLFYREDNNILPTDGDLFLNIKSFSRDGYKDIDVIHFDKHGKVVFSTTTSNQTIIYSRPEYTTDGSESEHIFAVLNYPKIEETERLYLFERYTVAFDYNNYIQMHGYSKYSFDLHYGSPDRGKTVYYFLSVESGSLNNNDCYLYVNGIQNSSVISNVTVNNSTFLYSFGGNSFVLPDNYNRINITILASSPSTASNVKKYRLYFVSNDDGKQQAEAYVKVHILDTRQRVSSINDITEDSSSLTVNTENLTFGNTLSVLIPKSSDISFNENIISSRIDNNYYQYDILNNSLEFQSVRYIPINSLIDHTTEGNESVNYKVYSNNFYYLDTLSFNLIDSSLTRLLEITATTTTVDEITSKSVTITISTANISNSIQNRLNLSINYTNCDSNDFHIVNPAIGNELVFTSDVLTLTFTTVDDFTTEGNGSLTISVTDPVVNNTVSVSIIVTDNSLTPSKIISRTYSLVEYINNNIELKVLDSINGNIYLEFVKVLADKIDLSAGLIAYDSNKSYKEVNVSNVTSTETYNRSSYKLVNTSIQCKLESFSYKSNENYNVKIYSDSSLTTNIGIVYITYKSFFSNDVPSLEIISTKNTASLGDDIEVVGNFNNHVFYPKEYFGFCNSFTDDHYVTFNVKCVYKLKNSSTESEGLDILDSQSIDNFFSSTEAVLTPVLVGDNYDTTNNNVTYTLISNASGQLKSGMFPIFEENPINTTLFLKLKSGGFFADDYDYVEIRCYISSNFIKYIGAYGSYCKGKLESTKVINVSLPSKTVIVTDTVNTLKSIKYSSDLYTFNSGSSVSIFTPTVDPSSLPVNFSINPALPTGLTFSQFGGISGSTSIINSVSYTVTAVDGKGTVATDTFIINIVPESSSSGGGGTSVDTPTPQTGDDTSNPPVPPGEEEEEEEEAILEYRIIVKDILNQVIINPDSTDSNGLAYYTLPLGFAEITLHIKGLTLREDVYLSLTPLTYSISRSLLSTSFISMFTSKYFKASYGGEENGYSTYYIVFSVQNFFSNSFNFSFFYYRKKYISITSANFNVYAVNPSNPIDFFSFIPTGTVTNLDVSIKSALFNVIVDKNTIYMVSVDNPAVSVNSLIYSGEKIYGNAVNNNYYMNVVITWDDLSIRSCKLIIKNYNSETLIPLTFFVREQPSIPPPEPSYEFFYNNGGVHSNRLELYRYTDPTLNVTLSCFKDDNRDTSVRIFSATSNSTFPEGITLNSDNGSLSGSLTGYHNTTFFITITINTSVGRFDFDISIKTISVGQPSDCNDDVRIHSASYENNNNLKFWVDEHLSFPLGVALCNCRFLGSSLLEMSTADDNRLSSKGISISKDISGSYGAVYGKVNQQFNLDNISYKLKAVGEDNSVVEKDVSFSVMGALRPRKIPYDKSMKATIAVENENLVYSRNPSHPNRTLRATIYFEGFDTVLEYSGMFYAEIFIGQTIVADDGSMTYSAPVGRFSSTDYDKGRLISVRNKTYTFSTSTAVPVCGTDKTEYYFNIAVKFVTDTSSGKHPVIGISDECHIESYHCEPFTIETLPTQTSFETSDVFYVYLSGGEAYSSDILYKTTIPNDNDSIVEETKLSDYIFKYKFLKATTFSLTFCEARECESLRLTVVDRDVSVKINVFRFVEVASLPSWASYADTYTYCIQWATSNTVRGTLVIFNNDSGVIAEDKVIDAVTIFNGVMFLDNNLSDNNLTATLTVTGVSGDEKIISRKHTVASAFITKFECSFLEDRPDITPESGCNQYLEIEMKHIFGYKITFLNADDLYYHSNLEKESSGWTTYIDQTQFNIQLSQYVTHRRLKVEITCKVLEGNGEYRDLYRYLMIYPIKNMNISLSPYLGCDSYHYPVRDNSATISSFAFRAVRDNPSMSYYYDIYEHYVVFNVETSDEKPFKVWMDFPSYPHPIYYRDAIIRGHFALPIATNLLFLPNGNRTEASISIRSSAFIGQDSYGYIPFDLTKCPLPPPPPAGSSSTETGPANPPTGGGGSNPTTPSGSSFTRFEYRQRSYSYDAGYNLKIDPYILSHGLTFVDRAVRYIHIRISGFQPLPVGSDLNGVYFKNDGTIEGTLARPGETYRCYVTLTTNTGVSLTDVVEIATYHSDSGGGGGGSGGGGGDGPPDCIYPFCPGDKVPIPEPKPKPTPPKQDLTCEWCLATSLIIPECQDMIKNGECGTPSSDPIPPDPDARCKDFIIGFLGEVICPPPSCTGGTLCEGIKDDGEQGVTVESTIHMYSMVNAFSPDDGTNVLVTMLIEGEMARSTPSISFTKYILSGPIRNIKKLMDKYNTSKYSFLKNKIIFYYIFYSQKPGESGYTEVLRKSSEVVGFGALAIPLTPLATHMYNGSRSVVWYEESNSLILPNYSLYKELMSDYGLKYTDLVKRVKEGFEDANDDLLNVYLVSAIRFKYPLLYNATQIPTDVNYTLHEVRGMFFNLLYCFTLYKKYSSSCERYTLDSKTIAFDEIFSVKSPDSTNIVNNSINYWRTSLQEIEIPFRGELGFKFYWETAIVELVDDIPPEYTNTSIYSYNDDEGISFDIDYSRNEDGSMISSEDTASYANGLETLKRPLHYDITILLRLSNIKRGLYMNPYVQYKNYSPEQQTRDLLPRWIKLKVTKAKFSFTSLNIVTQGIDIGSYTHQYISSSTNVMPLIYNVLNIIPYEDKFHLLASSYQVVTFNKNVAIEEIPWKKEGKWAKRVRIGLQLVMYSIQAAMIASNPGAFLTSLILNFPQGKTLVDIIFEKMIEANSGNDDLVELLFLLKGVSSAAVAYQTGSINGNPADYMNFIAKAQQETADFYFKQTLANMKEAELDRKKFERDIANLIDEGNRKLFNINAKPNNIDIDSIVRNVMRTLNEQGVRDLSEPIDI